MPGGPHFIHVYILLCADGSYYPGMTSDLQLRLSEHEQGVDPKSYTCARRPVRLIWSQAFTSHDDAFRAEHQIKGWSRKKKEALMAGDFETLHLIVRQEWERDSGREQAG